MVKKGKIAILDGSRVVIFIEVGRAAQSLRLHYQGVYGVEEQLNLNCIVRGICEAGSRNLNQQVTDRG